eukprot:1060844-Prorocentrum_minimum.AAC.3
MRGFGSAGVGSVLLTVRSFGVSIFSFGILKSSSALTMVRWTVEILGCLRGAHGAAPLLGRLGVHTAARGGCDVSVWKGATAPWSSMPPNGSSKNPPNIQRGSK